MSNSNSNPVPYQADIGDYPIKVTALGGLDEMGKNCYVIEVDNDAFVIEAGLKYPPKNTPGVDVIIPDYTYLEHIAKRVKAIIITHGHDDQFGGLGHLLKAVNVPVYATETTIAVIKTAAPKRSPIHKAEFIPVSASQDISIAGHEFQLFSTTHSIAESFGFALKTRFGNIIYTGDFMSDYSPLKGFTFDLPKVARISEEQKTFLLMAESESADKPGIASPNHKLTPVLQPVFEDPTGKTFVSLYSQNFYNIQEVINMAKHYRKKICIANPSQIPFFDEMAKIGDIVIPQNMRVSLDDLPVTPRKDVIILITGSGEDLLSYCKDICYGAVKNIKVDSTDTWINAAPSVPGTEVLHTETSDTIYRTDCHVIQMTRKNIASMHAREEDLKMMITLFRPKYYMPIKGDYRLLMANAKLAISLGIGLNHFNTFVYDNGMALCFDNSGKPVRKIIQVRSGNVLVDSTGATDIKESTVKERAQMADGGVVMMGITISSKNRTIISKADTQMRGFLYFKDSQDVINKLNELLSYQVNNVFDSNKRVNTNDIERRVSEKASRYLRKETDKDPLIVCKVLDVDALEEVDPH